MVLRPQENAFQWRIAGIEPDDAARHLRLAVVESQDDPSPKAKDAAPVLCAEVQFTLPHSTLSKTLVEGRIEPKTGVDAVAKNLLVDEQCRSGNYSADSNYE